jgi:predicted nuclease of predicted toxin-antitoxin system
MRFLADVGIGARVVGWRRDNGHDVTHLSEEGLLPLPNGEIFGKGIAERRVILTFDLDFGEIAALSRGRKASVVVFRLHNTRSDHVIARLSVVLEKSMSALETGAVVVVEESRHRIRYLPITR